MSRLRVGLIRNLKITLNGNKEGRVKCTDCKYCVEEDFGYSNYTVEGTIADCLKSLNPDLPEDRWYKEEPALDYAEKCNSFSEGKTVQIDCDREEDFPDGYADDLEIIELLKIWDLKN